MQIIQHLKYDFITLILLNGIQPDFPDNDDLHFIYAHYYSEY